MVNKRASPKKGKKRYTFRFTLSSLLLLCISLIFVLGWVFSLGIMVGRGFLPGTIDTLSSINEKIAKDEEEKKIDNLMPIKEEELTFYNQLIYKKDVAKKKVLPKPPSKDQDRTTKKTKVGKLRKDIRNYNVQVAALKDEGKTVKMVESLTGLGYPAYYYQTLINGEMYYRIRCGPFPNMEEAKKWAKRLADKEGFKPFIIYPIKMN